MVCFYNVTSIPYYNNPGNKAGRTLTPTRPFCSNSYWSSPQDPKDIGFLLNLNSSEGARKPVSERHAVLL